MLASELLLFLNCTKEHTATGVGESTLPHILSDMKVMRFNLHHRQKGHLPLRSGKVTLPVTVKSSLTKSMLPSGGKTEKQV